MAEMFNIEKNISFVINLLNNELLDVEISRDDIQNWIPFEFLLNVNGEEYNYLTKDGATFSLFELKRLLYGFQDIINQKKNGQNIGKFEFCSFENFFDIILSDPLEENMVSIEIWVNIGTLTNGKSFGYNKGFQFEVYVDILESFTTDIMEQLEKLTHN